MLCKNTHGHVIEVGATGVQVWSESKDSRMTVLKMEMSAQRNEIQAFSGI